jgi:hypothetical protein
MRKAAMWFLKISLFTHVLSYLVLPEFSSEPRFEPELRSSSGKFSSGFREEGI